MVESHLFPSWRFGEMLFCYLLEVGAPPLFTAVFAVRVHDVGQVNTAVNILIVPWDIVAEQLLSHIHDLNLNIFPIHD